MIGDVRTEMRAIWVYLYLHRYNMSRSRVRGLQRAKNQAKWRFRTLKIPIFSPLRAQPWWARSGSSRRVTFLTWHI